LNSFRINGKTLLSLVGKINEVLENSLLSNINLHQSQVEYLELINEKLFALSPESTIDTILSNNAISLSFSGSQTFDLTSEKTIMLKIKNRYFIEQLNI
jgi:hypothetical protein